MAMHRNFRLGVYNGLIYIFSETLLDPTLVLVAFLSLLTNSPVILGLVVPLRDGTWALPQLWVSGFLQSVPKKIDIYRKLSYMRIFCWGLLALSINFIENRVILLIAFFLSYGLGSLASGFSGLPFLEVVSKTIPAERRGEFFAWRFGLGGFFSIGASIFVRWVIDPNGPLAFPHNYGLLAVLYFLLASFSLLLFNAVEEPEDTHLLPRAPFSNQLKRALVFVRGDRNYRSFIALQSTLTVAGMATPFFAVYVQQSLGGSKMMIGVYLAILAVTNLTANIVFGRMSRRMGNRRVMFFAALFGMLMSLLVLLLALLAPVFSLSAQAASNWLIPVFILSGFRSTGIGVSANSLLLDIAPSEDRSVYLGFTNTFQGIVMLLTGLSGVILSFTGFTGLVLITLAAHAAAMFSTSGIKVNRTPA